MKTTDFTRPSRLEGKRVLVTGGASGIGRAIVQLAVESGARVAVVDYDIEAAKALVAEIGSAAVAIQADIGYVEQINSAVDQAVRELGGIDVLVNVAGVQDRMEPVDAVTPELWDRVFAINVRGTAFMIQRVMREFLPRSEGVIVNISSTASLLGGGGGAAYTASKGALASLTRQVAWELAGTGIRINALAPGATATNILANTARVIGADSGSERARANLERAIGEFDDKKILLGRAADPREIAQAAIFLASDESSYLHGTQIVVDGGLSIH
ncbi:SDR family NAD(P)-dependent oxidoreductase [Pseudomonas sp. H11T01]|uniref:SDR family NAD(P)-dependent oxidoreductase n=1 Tax=Pseudomonas sp. H11T01 TaxID=3402749 RepID=UPI003AD2B388